MNQNTAPAEQSKIPRKPIQKDDPKLGEVLTKQGALTRQELDKTLLEQEEHREKRVGDILADKKDVNRAELEKALTKAKKSSKISKNAKVGEILIASGLVTRKQLKEVLLSQLNEKNERIGSLLIRTGLITENQLLFALAHKFKLRFINLVETPPTPDALGSLSELIVTSMHIIPIELKRKTLVVATADPTDPMLSEYLSFNTGFSIDLVVATKQQIFEAQKKYYQLDEEQVEELIEEMAIEAQEDIEAKEVQSSPEPLSAAEQLKESDSKVTNLVYKVLVSAVNQKASDIHFEPEFGSGPLTIRFRVDGVCRVVHKIPSTYKRAVVSRLKILASLDIAERRKPQSGKIFLKSKDEKLEFRVETVPIAGGHEAAVLRVMADAKVIPLDQMGFSKNNLINFKKLLTKPNGIILCVGPTGSGKTTSLHSALGHINTPERKIWTAEDPVEITQPGLSQLQINHKIGLTFSEALRSFLRLDPDIIMVGEMRDLETASIAMEASLTGHLVFSTLHTNGSAETVTRLLDIGLDSFHFSDALCGILAQRLVLKLCDHCKKTYHPDENEYKKLIRSYGAKLAKDDELPCYSDNLTLRRKKGCDRCNGTGYLGRIGIHELLLATDDIKRAIVNRDSVTDLRYLAVQNGMRTLKMDGIQKVFQGTTDYGQILKVCI